MEHLQPDSVLICASNLKLHMTSHNFIRISIDNTRIQTGAHTLAILYAFRQPTKLEQALVTLNSNVGDAFDWMQMMSDIMLLYGQGVLINVAQTKPQLSEDDDFGRAGIHIAMLNDRQRTEGYLAAIREVVRPGDVVVDLGTGSGILAISAVQAGAGHVYAIEASAIAEAARLNFEQNQVSERITLIRGWSTQIELPEKADLLISEIIGDDPLEEQIIGYMSDAVKRFLNPNAQILPFKLSIYAQPFTLPDDLLRKLAFTEATLDDWKNWYGIDFQALKQVKTARSFRLDFLAQTPRKWVHLSEPFLLQDIDLNQDRPVIIDGVASFTTQTAGRLDAMLIYPIIHLTPSRSLSRSPISVDEKNHWQSPIWVLPQMYQTKTGDKFTITYKYGEFGKHYIDVVRE